MKKNLDKNSLSNVAPKLAELTEDVLFGDIWKRTQLSPRDRSLITVASLVASGRLQQLPWHINFARQNGISDGELTEVFTHLAFYAGWPAAVSALSCMDKENI